MKKLFLLLLIGLTTISTFAITNTFTSKETLPNVPITSPAPLHYCDLNNDGFGVFDLSSTISVVINGASPALYIIKFYESVSDATIGSSTSLPTIYANSTPWNQTIYIGVTEIATNDYQVATCQLIVDPKPEANTPNDHHLCDFEGPIGYESFDLTTAIQEILGNINPETTSVTFYDTQANEESGIGAISNVTSYTNASPWTQTLFVRIETIATGCYDSVQLTLVVDPIPSATQPYPEYSLCDFTGAIGYEPFNLSSQIPNILLGQTGMMVTFYPSIIQAYSGINPITNPSNYLNTNISVQTIGIRITNVITGCFVVSSMDLRVLPAPSLPAIIPTLAAYDINNDGQETFDITTNNNYLVGGNTSIFSFSYYTNASDAENQVNAIANPTAYVSTGGNIWIRIDTGNQCYVLVQQPLSVVTTFDTIGFYTYNGVNSICVDYTTGEVLRPLTLYCNIGNPNACTIQWSSNGTPIIGAHDTEYTVNTPSENIQILITYSDGTVMTGAYSIIQSGPASILDAGVTNLSGVQTVTLSCSGYGIYQFQMDEGIFQSSPVFENVSEGAHTFVARDIKDANGSCGDTLLLIIVAPSLVDAPTGATSQTFAPGATLANIIVTGSNILWYASAANKNATATPLPLNTLLVDNTTYYATQTVNGIESVARLPVTVHISLGNIQNNLLPLEFAPNPVKDRITLQSTQIITKVIVYNLLGQKVMDESCNNDAISIDVSNLTSGNYILKAQGETGQNAIRIVKE